MGSHTESTLLESGRVLYWEPREGVWTNRFDLESAKKNFFAEEKILAPLALSGGCKNALDSLVIVSLNCLCIEHNFKQTTRDRTLSRSV